MRSEPTLRAAQSELKPSAGATRRYELHVDGDVVAEGADPAQLASLARRYAGYDRVGIVAA
jgi:hypothetical protein